MRTFVLVAPTMLEKKEWCDALTMAKVNYQSGPGAPSGLSSGKRGSAKVQKIKKAERKMSKKMGMNLGQ